MKAKYLLILFVSGVMISLNSCKSGSTDPEEPEEPQIDSNLIEVPEVDTLTKAEVVGELDSLMNMQVEDTDAKAKTQKMIASFVDHCRRDEFWELGQYMWYIGRKDKPRRYNDLRTREKDKKSLSYESAHVRTWIGTSEDLEWDSYTTKEDTLGTWHYWEVDFVGANKVEFGCLERKGKVAIGTMRLIHEE